MSAAGGSLSKSDRLIVEAATGARPLAEHELRRVLDHVAQAGFHATARERARGRLAGVVWEGRIVQIGDMLRPAEVHYLWHVLRNQEWPQDTTLPDYVESIRRVIPDRDSGVFTNRFQGAWSLGIVRESRELRGPDGHDWVLVQYRVGWSHWVTAFQPASGLQELHKPQWSDIGWLRPPRHSNES